MVWEFIDGAMVAYFGAHLKMVSNMVSANGKAKKIN